MINALGSASPHYDYGLTKPKRQAELVARFLKVFDLCNVNNVVLNNILDSCTKIKIKINNK